MVFCVRYSKLFIQDPSVQIYVNKIENRVTSKIKNGDSLEVLTPETTKLLGSTKMKQLKTKTVKMCLILNLQK